MEIMRNFINWPAVRFNVALRTQPFATSIRIYSGVSSTVGIAGLVVTLIASSIPAITIPAAIITLVAAYVFYKTVVNSIAADEEICGSAIDMGVVNRRLQVTQERCAALFNHKMKQVFVIAGLIRMKNFIS